MQENWPDFNDLWDYNDPAATEVKFRALLAQLGQGADTSYRLQLLTQIARTLGLQRKFAEAHALLNQVESNLNSDPVVEVRYLLERGRAFNSDKQPEKAMPLFERAFEVARAAGADFYTVDALHMLGIAAPPQDRLTWNLKAVDYAVQSEQQRARNWLGSLYNNIGWTYFDEHQYDRALDHFERALAFQQQAGNDAKIRIARWCVAKGLRYVGRVEEALAIQRELAALDDSDGFIPEEIAECLHALGKTDEARPYFRRAYEMLSKIAWVAEDTARIERLKQLSL